MSDLEFTPAALNIDGSRSGTATIARGETTKGDPFYGPHINGFIFVQRYGFWLDLSNTSDRPITVLWPEARYVDELGEAHELLPGPEGRPDDVEGMTVGPPVELGPVELTRYTVVPLYKQYRARAGCEGTFAYSEPLIPTNLRELSEEDAKARVDEIAEKQIPVKLVLPIEAGGERYDYVFSFTLRNWREGLREATPEEQKKIDELEKMIDAMEASDGMDLGEDHP